jgi:hypothetical protein
MELKRKSWSLVLAALAAGAGVAACTGSHGTDLRHSGGGQKSAAGVSPPVPPEQPCSIDVSRLASLVAQSSLEVDAKVVVTPTVGSPIGTRSSYEYAIASAATYSASGDGSETGPIDVNAEDIQLMYGGEYVLFLSPMPSSTASATPSYYIAQGYDGRFLINSGTVTMNCANFQDPSSPLTASGSGMTVSDFDSLLQAATSQAKTLPSPSSKPPTASTTSLSS